MALGVPEEVEEKQVVFAGIEARSPSHHLREESAALGGPKHHDAVAYGTVPSLGEQHGAGEASGLAALEARQDLGTVDAVPVNLLGWDADGV